jgi:NAD(P)-dependent dehydrogenase (short-subunit alcohol dehydrogenase family)
VELEGKVALITGGAVRLGRALALALAGRGIRIALHYVSSREMAEETASLIRGSGGEALLIPADLRRIEGTRDIVRQAGEHFGRLDILINNAAIFRPGGWRETDEENWDSHFEINLKAPFFLSQAFAAQIGESGSGQILNILDGRILQPDGSHVAYNLTKAALSTMTRILSGALAPNIRVNGIAPGAVLPPPGKDPAYLESLAANIPLRRAGSPADVTDAALYLLQSDFVTGQVIFVTGGQYL